MNIQELHINGFGHFANKPYTGLSNNLVVFYGSNEAGKTTLLEFIWTLLFGFPKTKPEEYYPPLVGGTHGGYALIKLNGQNSQLQRYQRGKKSEGGELQHDGRTIQQEWLTGQLGGVTKERYKNTFALTLDELSQAKNSNLNEWLYQAALGANWLPNVKKVITKDKEELFRPKANKPKLNDLSNKLIEIQKKLQSITREFDNFDQLENEIKEWDNRIAEIDRTIRELMEKRRFSQGVSQAWQDWEELRQIESELLTLIPFSDHEAQQLAALGIQVGQSGKEPGHIENIFSQISTRKENLPSIETEFREKMQALGTDWNEDQVRDFVASVEFRNTASTYQERLDEAKRGVEKAEAKTHSRAGDEAEATARLEGLQQDRDDQVKPVLSADQVVKAKEGLAKFEVKLEVHKRAKAEVIGYRQIPSTSAPSRAIWLATLVAGAIIALVGVLAPDEINFGNPWSWGSLVVGGTAMLSALVMLARRNNSVVAGQNQEDLPRALQESDSALEEARELAVELELQPNINSLEGYELAVKHQRDHLAAQDKLVEAVGTSDKNIQSAKTELERRCELVKQSERDFQQMQDKHAQALQDWTEWLTEQRFPSNYRPDAIRDFVTRVDSLQGLLASIKLRRKQITKDEAVVQEFQTRLADITQGKVPNNESIRIDFYTAISVCQDLTEQSSRFKELKDRQNQIESKLKERISTEDKEFRQALAPLSESDVAEQLKTLTEEIDRLQSEQPLAQEKLFELKAHQRGLADGHEEASLRQQREELLAQAEPIAEEWARLRVVEEVLRRAQQKFEQERQPDVLKHAGQFMSSITSSRYSEIRVQLDSNELQVLEQSGKFKSPGQLSRGTQEQLYLAVRLGYIRNFSQYAQPLPIIVDEVLVNFDPARARQTAIAFTEMAATNQVIVFTCHPEIRDLFADVYKDTQIIEL